MALWNQEDAKLNRLLKEGCWRQSGIRAETAGRRNKVQQRVRCTNQGRRLNKGLSEITPDLVTRTVTTGSRHVQFINLILRVGKLIDRGYSESEAVGLFDMPISLNAPLWRGRSKHAKLKTIKTLGGPGQSHVCYTTSVRSDL